MSLNTMKCLLETNKLIGSNFPDWLHNLRLVLRMDNIEYVLDEPISDIPDEASEAFKSFDKDRRKKHIDDAIFAQCIMLGSMTSQLYRQHEYMFPYEMRVHLESLYTAQAKTIEYVILRDLFRSKMHEGNNVSNHVLKMISLIEKCSMIGIKLPENVSINLILQSLPLSFENFIVNFNMNNTKATLHELHNMLRTFKSSPTKGKTILMMNSYVNSNLKGKKKQKKKRSKKVVFKPKGGVQKKQKLTKDECLFCHEKGHWKKDCPKFKALGASTSNTGLTNSTKVKPGEVDL